ncbi:MFS polyamine transporter [Mycena floridula]|nr:MFS polyamine transporter [Mycena floridula]
MDHDTPSSSITVLHPASPRAMPQSPLEEEIAEDEARIERYGGDDVRDPDASHHDFKSAAPTIVENSPPIAAWDGPDDPENPQNWSLFYQWVVVAICVVMTVNVTFASSAPSALTAKIIAAFNIVPEVSYLITSVFLLGYVVGSLFWGSGSELFGRRRVVLFSLSCYTLLHLGQALAKNIETLLVTRFLAGFFAVSPLIVSGGIIADMLGPVRRGYAMSIFSASVFLGPVLGPVVGGAIADSSLSWEWVFWVMMMFAGACTATAAVFVPETYAPIILQRKAARLRKQDPVLYKDLRSEHENQDWSLQGVAHRTIYRPFHMLVLEPILVLVTIYLSIVYGVLYALFEALPIIFIQHRGFTTLQSGLIFVGVGIGTTLGAILNYVLSLHYPGLMQRWKGFPPPEQRLFGSMVGAPLLVIGSFWLGWSGHYDNVPWYVPGLATVVLGAGISLIFMSFLSYLVDTYLMYSASALAASSVLRSMVGAAFPLFTVQMFNKLGINWACTLVGLIGLLFVPSPFLFYKYGPWIRGSSKFAPCIDLKIAKELLEEEQKTSGKV